MKRLMLIGPSQCGKTSLTQGLRGEALHYKKTQAIEWSPMAIDTPGEYLENRCLYSALITTSYDADVVALVQSADHPQSFFAPQFASVFNKPVIGIITKADQGQDAAALEAARDKLQLAGAHTLFVTSALTREGIAPLLDYLN